MTERTIEELRAEISVRRKQFERPERDRKLRQGKARPRTQRELSIFCADYARTSVTDDSEDFGT